MKMVYKTLDELEPMSREALDRLAAMTDEEIDYSDIPPSPPEKWQQAVRGGFYRPVKQQVTLRLDKDVLEWFKSGGHGYQTRINAILRQAMLEKLMTSHV